MAKKKVTLPEAAPDVLAAVMEPVAPAVPQEIKKVKKEKSPKPAKVAVVLAEQVVAKKKAPAKKAIVKKENAPVVAPIVEAPKEMPKEDIPVEAALPVLMAEVEADKAEKKSFVSAPKVDAEAPVFPISRRPAPRPPMRPTMHPVKQTSVQVETKTKTAVAVGLAAAGALALAAAAAFLSMKDLRPNIMRPFATRPFMSAPVTAPYQPRIVSQFLISLNRGIVVPPSAEILGNGSEYALAAINVSTSGAAWTFDRLRVKLTGSEFLKSLVVRDEKGNPIFGSVVPVPNTDHQYDVMFSQKIPANGSKVYTLFASFMATSTKVPVMLTVMTDGLSARSDVGENASSLRAPLSGPQWYVAPAPVVPPPTKLTPKPKR